MRARRPGPVVRTRVTELRGTEPLEREDHLVTEEPLEIRLEWPGRAAHRVWVTMRTPGHDFELAAGWAFHEGLLGAEPPRRVAYCTDADLAPEQEFNVVTLSLAAPPPHEPHQHGALSAGSSACGVCGRDVLTDVLAQAAPRWTGARPGIEVIRALPAALGEAQTVFARTGGAHAAALAGADGVLRVFREDVGRHNALDKVTGARLLAGDPVADAVVVVSGRVGFELVQKALAAGVGALAAVGAPTSLAVDLARAGGLELYGFIRPERAVRYA